MFFAAFVPALVGALATVMASLLFRALLAVGIGFVTYTGITVAVTTFKTQAISSVSSLTGDALGLLGYLWIDKAMTLVFSAIVASLTIKAIGGSLKKMVLK
jgi:hypothetical protein